MNRIFFSKKGNWLHEAPFWEEGRTTAKKLKRMKEEEALEKFNFNGKIIHAKAEGGLKGSWGGNPPSTYTSFLVHNEKSQDHFFSWKAFSTFHDPSLRLQMTFFLHGPFVYYVFCLICIQARSTQEVIEDMCAGDKRAKSSERLFKLRATQES